MERLQEDLGGPRRWPRKGHFHSGPGDGDGDSSKQVTFFFFLLYFFKLFYFILFIFGYIGSWLLHVGFWRAGATLCCGARASHCGGFSCCGARALGHAGSVVVACGLQSAGSAVVTHGLICSVACGIFLDQGSNPFPLHWQVDS